MCTGSGYPTDNLRPGHTTCLGSEHRTCRAHPWQVRRRVSKARVSSGLSQRHPSQRPGWMPRWAIVLKRASHSCLLERQAASSYSAAPACHGLRALGQHAKQSPIRHHLSAELCCRLSWADHNTGRSRLATRQACKIVFLCLRTPAPGAVDVQNMVRLCSVDSFLDC